MSNALTEPPNEGIKKLAQRTAAHFRNRGLPVVRVDDDSPFLVRKLLIGRGFFRSVRSHRPRAVVYIPTQSLTLGTYVRIFILRTAARSPVVVIAAQSGKPPAGERHLARVLGPDLVLTPSPDLLRRIQGLGRNAAFLPMGVDVPAQPGDAPSLRRKHGIPADRPVVLHVGHLTSRRNLAWLVRIQRELGANVVVATTPTQWTDASIRAEIEQAGVHVIDEFIDPISDLYLACDCYAFPVLDPNGAIGVPLSVLEAMVCNRRVVTTPFGGLPMMFGSVEGLTYAGDEGAFVAAVAEMLSADPSWVRTRAAVMQYTWDGVVDLILKHASAATDG